MKTRSNGPSSSFDGIERRTDPLLDPVAVRARSEVAARDLGDLRVDLAGHDPPLGHESRGHRQRGVAAVSTDLEHPARPGGEHEQLEEAALDGPGHHLRGRQAGPGLLGERHEVLGRRSRVLLGVALDFGVDDRVHVVSAVGGRDR